MPETATETHEEKAPDPVRKTVPAWLVTVIILLLAVAIFFMVYGNGTAGRAIADSRA